MNRSRIQIAKNDIINYFDAHSSKFFSYREIGAILSKERGFWRLAENTNTEFFIDFLKKQKLQEYRFEFPNRGETVYVWGEAPLLQILSNIHNRPVFSHYSAAQIHGLTEQSPTSVYLNVGKGRSDYSPRQEHEAPPQENIDRAFRRPPRITTNVAQVAGRSIYMLNTTERYENIGVVLQDIQDEEARFETRVTGLERTLIDMAVRPFYSGGVGEVLKAYRIARQRVSVNKLVSMLGELNYIYPYHQAIGFYAQKAGYRSSQINLLKKKPMKRNFYLDYEMSSPDYISDWKLFVPHGF